MSTGTQPDWRRGRVVASDPVAQETRRITIERPARGRAAPGSHLDVRVRIGDVTDTRSYSVVESDPSGGRLTISVLRCVPSRGGSTFMHELAVGDEVEVTQPLQNFPLRVGARRYVLLAGGIGITALVEMGRVLRSLGADYTLVYVGRSRGRMAYLRELTALHGKRLVAAIDDEGSALDVAALVAGVAHDPLGAETELYMCGPIRLMDAVRREWESAQLPASNLRYETFGSSGWFRPEEFTVRIPQLQLETTVGADETMLEALTRAGADLMYDCRKGECGLCCIDIDQVDGRVDHRDVFLSSAQKSGDRSLCTCVSRIVAAGARDRPAVSLVLPGAAARTPSLP
ncbi:PDR/VanB family oxidoreductase [Phycicoccus sp. Soil803]|uniref:PDR/VanB family oxidoreductase n=1 Tax=Phycicoccus sp. Soil803 TaxID=1736415 RepID=UPI00070FF348|nr:PDR/VanB family oxidoreductase [Phycicoccus sp. Soil803]KRF26017.1 flavodoxin [Phycicoccus sp. Soil803]